MQLPGQPERARPAAGARAPGLRAVAADGAREQVLRRQLERQRRPSLARAVAERRAERRTERRAIAGRVQVEPVVMVVVRVVPCARVRGVGSRQCGRLVPNPGQGGQGGACPWLRAPGPGSLLRDAHWSADPGALVSRAAGQLTDVMSWSSAAAASRPAQMHTLQHDRSRCARGAACPRAPCAHQTFPTATGSPRRSARGWGGCPRSRVAQRPAAQHLRHRTRQGGARCSSTERSPGTQAATEPTKALCRAADTSRPKRGPLLLPGSSGKPLCVAVSRGQDGKPQECCAAGACSRRARARAAASQ